jgi:hypothetical protein
MVSHRHPSGGMRSGGPQVGCKPVTPEAAHKMPPNREHNRAPGTDQEKSGR